MDKSPIQNNSNSKFSKEYQEQHIRPWMRFFAKHIDLYIFAIAVVITSEIFYPTLLSDNDVANGIMILFLWFIFEPIVLYFFGITLGKFLLSIKLTNLKNNRLNLLDFYKRSFGVWAVGFGFGIPIVSIFTMISAYVRLKKKGQHIGTKTNSLLHIVKLILSKF